MMCWGAPRSLHPHELLRNEVLTGPLTQLPFAPELSGALRSSPELSGDLRSFPETSGAIWRSPE
eukprot:12552064-Alexandrium_andersonii.AAC.1